MYFALVVVFLNQDDPQHIRLYIQIFVLICLQAICRLTYNTESTGDRGTAYYFRNFLDARDVKGEVKNAYRPYKLLYYKILDAMCCVLFLKKFNKAIDEEIPFPDNFDNKSTEEKIHWLNENCREILNEYFFEFQNDTMQDLRAILTDQSHPENYYLTNLDNGKDRMSFFVRKLMHMLDH